MLITENIKVVVMGLGYVGLPLAVEFGKKFDTIGFDVSKDKVTSCEQFVDPTGELTQEQMRAAGRLIFTTDPACIASANFVIVAVPTPVDHAKIPDLSYLERASELAGRFMTKGVTLVYESTVFPGATEECCIPILERASGLTWREDFNVGYSPERVNPGDKDRTITKILKVVSGDSQQTLDELADLYGAVIEAGVYRAQSIRVAEAAKVIENTQRDLNIALINELAVVFDKMNIDTKAVLDAAGTKWNFLNFRPGLVGGHCIGVDPYYLTYKAQTYGYHPELILAGRRINDSMGSYVASRLVKEMARRGMQVNQAKILIMGLTFKENCSDLRNTRVIDVVEELREYGCLVDIYDPWVDADSAKREYGLDMQEHLQPKGYDAIVLAVGHSVFADMGLDAIRDVGVDHTLLFDLKYLFPSDRVDLRL